MTMIATPKLLSSHLLRYRAPFASPRLLRVGTSSSSAPVPLFKTRCGASISSSKRSTHQLVEAASLDGDRAPFASPRLLRVGTSSSSAPVPLFKTRCGVSISASKRSTHQLVEAASLDGKSTALGDEGDAFKKTLMLVECSMFASVAGLAYFLSNSLSIENYFGCFFSLPIVISSVRWGLAAGRKTMVATAMLLLTLSGPVKACTYLLMHGLVGLAMGSLWRLRINWGTSIVLCTFVRSVGAVGYVLVSSFLIRENILNLITINVHASLSYILMAIGVNAIPSMDLVYTIFGSLLLVNCGFFVFLLHILYAVFLRKLGMKVSLALPEWLDKAI